jgi:S-DNA-T family DNA segregation ATPase FtsK/SpoIIIE
VSPVIRANTNLRIALRVTDDSESTDVIDARDAARIAKSTPAGPTRGPASRRSRVPGRARGRPPAGRAAGPPPAFAAVVDWERLDAPIQRPQVAEDDSNLETDLQVLVDSIRSARPRPARRATAARGCRR